VIAEETEDAPNFKAAPCVQAAVGTTKPAKIAKPSKKRLQMKRLLILAGIAAFFSVSVMGQAPASRPAFDVAGIQVSTRPQPGMRGGQLRGNRYEIRNATMVDLIRTAYNVQPEKITGGPSWLEWNRFDIAALAPEKTPPDRLREMLKALLAEQLARCELDLQIPRSRQTSLVNELLPVWEIGRLGTRQLLCELRHGRATGRCYGGDTIRLRRALSIAPSAGRRRFL
jgi:hypothetical protein